MEFNHGFSWKVAFFRFRTSCLCSWRSWIKSWLLPSSLTLLMNCFMRAIPRSALSSWRAAAYPIHKLLHMTEWLLQIPLHSRQLQPLRLLCDSRQIKYRSSFWPFHKRANSSHHHCHAWLLHEAELRCANGSCNIHLFLILFKLLLFTCRWSNRAKLMSLVVRDQRWFLKILRHSQTR